MRSTVNLRLKSGPRWMRASLGAENAGFHSTVIVPIPISIMGAVISGGGGSCVRDGRPRWPADRVFDFNRHENWTLPDFRRGIGDWTGECPPDLPTPGKQQAAVGAVPSRDLRDVGSRREGLGHDRRLFPG